MKLDIENDKVVSTLSEVIYINFEIGNIESTLLNNVNSNVDIYDNFSMLISC